jgi:hypothetical protein
MLCIYNVVHNIYTYTNINFFENKNIIGFMCELFICLLKFIMYWNMMDKLKILKFKSDFLCLKCIIWIFSWFTYVDYASKFNNPYSYFHLNKYEKEIKMLTLWFFLHSNIGIWKFLYVIALFLM